MLRSYVAILDQTGLRQFVPEDSEAGLWLAQCASPLAQRNRLVCWAVLESDAADAVSECLEAGEFDVALRRLTAASRSLGSIPAHAA